MLKAVEDSLLWSFLSKARHAATCHVLFLWDRLKPADVQVMKKLHHKVNIVPLLAKSDILTKVEQKRLKQRVSSQWSW